MCHSEIIGHFRLLWIKREQAFNGYWCRGMKRYDKKLSLKHNILSQRFPLQKVQSNLERTSMAACKNVWHFDRRTIKGPLPDPVTSYGINYAGTQITQWDFQNKEKPGWTGKSSFVLEVPLRYLRPSVIFSVPYDRILQRACWPGTISTQLHGCKCDLKSFRLKTTQSTGQTRPIVAA